MRPLVGRAPGGSHVHRSSRVLWASDRCGSGLLGRPASESGRLCRADGRGDRSRKVLVLPMLSRALLAAVLLLTAAAGPPVNAQPAPKIPKIGLFVPGNPADFALALEAFKQGLQELGYVEGKTLVLEL